MYNHIIVVPIYPSSTGISVHAGLVMGFVNYFGMGEELAHADASFTINDLGPCHMF